MEKSKKESAVDIYKRRKEAADDLIATHDLISGEAYTTTMRKYLYNPKRGRIELGKLKGKKGKELREKIGDDIAKYHLKKIKERLQLNANLDKDEENMLIHAYFGVTKPIIKKIVHTLKNGMTLPLYQAHMKKAKENVESRLYSSALSHINKKEHLDEIIKYTGADKFINNNMMTDEDLRFLLDFYENNKALGEPFYEELRKQNKEYLIKEEKKKAA